MRVIQTLTAGDFSAKVYRNSEWNEYVTRFYENGAYLGTDCDGHTDDKADALTTAQTEVNRMAAAAAPAPVSVPAPAAPAAKVSRLAEVLESLRSNHERDDTAGWLAVYLDNAQPAGMTKHEYAGYLGALERAGQYRASEDPDYQGHWGYVRIEA